MKKYKLIFFWCLIIGILSLISCSVSKEESVDKELTTISFLDGTDIEVPENIETYATLAPSYTETLIDLGFEKNIVTIDSNSTYLNVYSDKVSVFNVEKIDLSVTTILENKPDVILIESLIYAKLTGEEIEDVKSNGSTFVVLPTVRSVEEVRNELDFIVRLTNAKYGAKILADFDFKYAQLVNWKNQVEEFPVVFLQIRDSKNIKTVGVNTLLDEMITLSGGTNAFADKNNVVYTTNAEIAARQPSYYFAITNGESTQKNQILNNVELSQTVAVRNEQVYVFTEEQMFNPNYRALDAVNAMGCILHSDIYK